MQALILVDLQNDYGSFGALPVEGAEQIIPIINALMDHFPIIVATKDWHPANHLSFAANHPWRHPEQVIQLNKIDQKLSIIHCVQNSFGAELLGGLNTEKITKTFNKGTEPSLGSHCAFYDKDQQRSTGLGEWLKAQNVTEVFILGLNTENSIQATLFNAIDFGFKTHFIEDATKGISKEQATEAIDEIKTKGIETLHSSYFLNHN